MSSFIGFLFTIHVVTLLLLSLLLLSLPSITSYQIPSNRIAFLLTKNLGENKLRISADLKFTEDSSVSNNSNDNIVPPSNQIEGYLSSDLASMNDGKQFRVFLYIALALVPCLFLIPFFLARDFTPAVDPEAYKF